MKVLNIILSMLLVCTAVHANEERGRRGPPAEAISACNSKQENDACSFEGRRGEASGKCMTRRETLSCVPEGHEERRQRRQRD